MLFVSGFGANAPMAELVALKKRVDQCIRWFPITGSNDTAASEAITCEMVGSSSGSRDSLLTFEKLSLLEPEDNAVMFDVVSAIVGGWRNTGMDAAVSRTEENVRRIAAQKLGEPAVADFSPTGAVQLLSQVGRVEPSNVVKVAIIRSLHVLLKTRDIPPTVRAEALTTLKTFADANILTNTVEVLNTATEALKDLAPKLEIGPVTITSVPASKPRSKYFIPLVAMGITAVAATGGLILFFRHQDARGLSAAGPLRRKAEAALRRRRAR
jgi:hypothetical protein